MLASRTEYLRHLKRSTFSTGRNRRARLTGGQSVVKSESRRSLLRESLSISESPKPTQLGNCGARGMEKLKADAVGGFTR